MIRVFGITLFVALLLVFIRCGGEIDKNTITGRYIATYKIENGPEHDELQIFSNGSYRHSFKYPDGFEYSYMGSWEIEYENGHEVYFYGFNLQYVFGKGNFPATNQIKTALDTLNLSDLVWIVKPDHSLLGNIRLVIDGDSYEYYVKQD